jgi:hypothetical protein
MPTPYTNARRWQSNSADGGPEALFYHDLAAGDTITISAMALDNWGDPTLTGNAADPWRLVIGATLTAISNTGDPGSVGDAFGLGVCPIGWNTPNNWPSWPSGAESSTNVPWFTNPPFTWGPTPPYNISLPGYWGPIPVAGWHPFPSYSTVGSIGFALGHAEPSCTYYTQSIMYQQGDWGNARFWFSVQGWGGYSNPTQQGNFELTYEITTASDPGWISGRRRSLESNSSAAVALPQPLPPPQAPVGGSPRRQLQDPATGIYIDGGGLWQSDSYTGAGGQEWGYVGSASPSQKFNLFELTAGADPANNCYPNNWEHEAIQLVLPTCEVTTFADGTPLTTVGLPANMNSYEGYEGIGADANEGPEALFYAEVGAGQTIIIGHTAENANGVPAVSIKGYGYISSSTDCCESAQLQFVLTDWPTYQWANEEATSKYFFYRVETPWPMVGPFAVQWSITHPVDCVGSWGAWGTECEYPHNGFNWPTGALGDAASGTCDTAVKRTYTVTQPALFGGVACSPGHGALGFDIAPCTSVPCDIDCVGSWGAWSTCPCGGGSSTRAFAVTTAATGTGGAACAVADGETQTFTCPVSTGN